MAMSVSSQKVYNRIDNLPEIPPRQHYRSEVMNGNINCPSTKYWPLSSHFYDENYDQYDLNVMKCNEQENRIKMDIEPGLSPPPPILPPKPLKPPLPLRLAPHYYSYRAPKNKMNMDERCAALRQEFLQFRDRQAQLKRQRQLEKSRLFYHQVPTTELTPSSSSSSSDGFESIC